MALGEDEGDEFGFLFWRPSTSREARIQASKPTLGALGATPSAADKFGDVDPGMDPEAMDTVEKAVVLVERPYAGPYRVCGVARLDNDRGIFRGM